MKQVDYMKIAQDAMERIKKGVFLTVKSSVGLNTMTIGWAILGYIWRKPMMTVAVRASRHTFSIIEKAKDFTVSIPTVDMKKEIAFCGTKSGRDYEKFKECNLTTAQSQQVVSPIIETSGFHFECKIVYKTAMDPGFLDESYQKSLYSDHDYHTLYFGEIVECYEKE